MAYRTSRCHEATPDLFEDAHKRFEELLPMPLPLHRQDWGLFAVAWKFVLLLPGETSYTEHEQSPMDLTRPMPKEQLNWLHPAFVPGPSLST